MKIQLGGKVQVDVDRLVETRMLLQASSGGGKSWAIRRLLEQSHGHVQHLVIDVEGEFFTLRERFDYVLAGRGGDCPADTKSAELLARRLLELGTSAILDIYELKAHERTRFVRLFLESLVGAPRELWRSCLVVVDEAHLFCPQHGEAESAAAVIDLMARGRKRGFCGVLATQRISKLHKDAAAEAQNKLIGLSSLDLDRKRAADELGLTGKAEALALRGLAPGSFHAFGPAISSEVVQVQVGPIVTAHPKAGQRSAPPPAPGDRVKKVLAQLADLPQQAAEEARSATELRGEIAKLKRELTLSRKGGIHPDDLKTANDEGFAAGLKARQAAHRTEVERVRKLAARAAAALGLVEPNARAIREVLDQLVGIEIPSPVPGVEPVGRPVRAAAPPSRADATPQERAAPPTDGDLPPARQRILDSLAFLEMVGVNQADRTQLALLADQSPTSSGYANNLGALRTAELVDYPSPARVALTSGGRVAANAPNPPPSTDDLHAMLRRRIPPSRWRILQVLIDAYPDAVDRDRLAELAEQSPTSSGYANNLGALRSLGLIDYPERGTARAKPSLFLEDR